MCPEALYRTTFVQHSLAAPCHTVAHPAAPVLVPEATVLDTMLTYFEHSPVTPGTLLIHHGDPANEFYFVESGRFQIRLLLVMVN